MVDRREHARRDVSIEARLFLREDKPAILPCRIIDISEGGAKVQIGFPYRLPAQLFLLKDDDDNIYECEAIWQSGQLVGLMFLDLCARGKRQAVLDELETAEVVEGTSS
jgi:hypothetical protein